jgi:hypothetical protein
MQQPERPQSEITVCMFWYKEGNIFGVFLLHTQNVPCYCHLTNLWIHGM